MHPLMDLPSTALKHPETDPTPGAGPSHQLHWEPHPPFQPYCTALCPTLPSSIRKHVVEQQQQ